MLLLPGVFGTCGYVTNCTNLSSPTQQTFSTSGFLWVRNLRGLSCGDCSWPMWGQVVNMLLPGVAATWGRWWLLAAILSCSMLTRQPLPRLCVPLWLSTCLLLGGREPNVEVAFFYDLIPEVACRPFCRISFVTRIMLTQCGRGPYNGGHRGSGFHT